MFRVFFGVPINKTVIAQLMRDANSISNLSATDISWIENEFLHVTVKFFESLNPDSLSFITQSAEHITKNIQSFTLKIKKIASFPTSQAKVLAAHIVSDEKLLLIHKLLSKTGEQLGIKPEMRRYRPHITLAKYKSGHHYVEPIYYSDLLLPVRELVLYESRSSAKGRQYIPLRRFKLLD